MGALISLRVRKGAIVWDGQEVLEAGQVARHNLRAALESAVQIVADARLACSDIEEQLWKLRNNLLTSIEELIWLEDED